MPASETEATSECSETLPTLDDEAVPQKLLLAPLLQRQQVSSSCANHAAVSTPTSAASTSASTSAASTSTQSKVFAPSSAASNWLRGWWQMSQEDDDIEDEHVEACGELLAEDARAERGALWAIATAMAAESRPSVEKMRSQLLKCVRLLRELQIENTALCEELLAEKQRAATSLHEVQTLRRENATLKATALSMASHAASLPPSSARSSRSGEACSAKEEIRHPEQSQNLLEVQLYQAQVALVTIVEELESRLTHQEVELERSETRLSEAQEDHNDMLEFFRKRAPGAEQLWREARVCANANTVKSAQGQGGHQRRY